MSAHGYRAMSDAESTDAAPTGSRPAEAPPAEAEPAPALVMTGVTVTLRGAAVLRAVNLSVNQGEMVAVTGRTGAGKSTLLNVAGGLLSPAAGLVTVAGRDLVGATPAEQAAARRDLVGYVFQQLNLLPTLTAGENVALPLQLAGMRPGPALDQAAAALAEVGLADVKDVLPTELSGGQEQMVAVARALVGERRLLLADEPTAALDDLSAEQVLRLLRTRARAGAAVLYVTHDPALAAWADRVVRLANGSVAEETHRASAAFQPAALYGHDESEINDG